jgi:hypothetical protein
MLRECGVVYRDTPSALWEDLTPFEAHCRNIKPPVRVDWWNRPAPPPALRIVKFKMHAEVAGGEVRWEEMSVARTAVMLGLVPRLLGLSKISCANE